MNIATTIFLRRFPRAGGAKIPIAQACRKLYFYTPPYTRRISTTVPLRVSSAESPSPPTQPLEPSEDTTQQPTFPIPIGLFFSHLNKAGLSIPSRFRRRVFQHYDGPGDRTLSHVHRPISETLKERGTTQEFTKPILESLLNTIKKASEARESRPGEKKEEVVDRIMEQLKGEGGMVVVDDDEAWGLVKEVVLELVDKGWGKGDL